jgi:Ca2+-binding RTX toxin-like protein
LVVLAGVPDPPDRQTEGVVVRTIRIGFTMTVAAVAAAGVTSVIPAQAATPTCHGVRATIVGTPTSEVIHGTPGRDVIVGRGGNDTIHAGAGNDLVCGGYGADRLYGGSGNDTLDGGHDWRHQIEDGTEFERIGDTLRGGPGNDRLLAGVDDRAAENIVEDMFSWDQAAHGVHIDLRRGSATGDGADSFTGGRFVVIGSRYGDVVEGTNRGDRIYTGPGPDVVRARGGSDYIAVDYLNSGLDTDKRRGIGGDDDRVWGGNGNDQIHAARGADRLFGGAGNDSIDDGGASNDVLAGGPGNDRLYGQIWHGHTLQRFGGGRGWDQLQLSSRAINPKSLPSTGGWNMTSGAMTFTLGHTITLSATYIDAVILDTVGTSWRVTGTPAGDEVYGEASSGTSFHGLSGNDIFSGTAGDDVFNGGPGRDHSIGMYNGNDTCISVEIIDGADCDHIR